MAAGALRRARRRRSGCHRHCRSWWRGAREARWNRLACVGATPRPRYRDRRGVATFSR
jgi:hypothetical protein